MERTPCQALLHDLLCDGRRRLGVVVELHRECGPPLGLRTQTGGITEHLTQRHQRVDHLARASVVGTTKHAATTTEVAHHVAHVVLRRHHLDLHDRLEQYRTRLAEAFLEPHRTGDLERHFRRIDLVVGAVHQADLDVDHGKSGQRAIGHRLLDTLVDRRDVFLRESHRRRLHSRIRNPVRAPAERSPARRGRTGPCRRTGERTCLPA